jgi:hypothetical protein
MAFSSYALECEGLADELRESLSESELSELHELLAGRPVIDWIRWRTANAALISAFVGATPSQRKKKMFREQRLLLTMAGIQHCLEAEALLTVLDDPLLSPGNSYRGMAAVAGDAYQRLYDFEIPDWPFDDLESPFADDRPHQ